MGDKPQAGSGYSEFSTTPDLSGRIFAARQRGARKALRPFAAGKAKVADWRRIETKGLPRASFAITVWAPPPDPPLILAGPRAFGGPAYTIPAGPEGWESQKQ